MDKVFIVLNCFDDTEKKIRIHNEESIKLLKVLRDWGYIDFSPLEDNICDVNEYTASLDD